MRWRGRRPRRIRRLRRLRWFDAANFAAAQKPWPGVRDDADPRGVLQGLPQPAPGRELFRAGAQLWQSGGTDRDQGISKAGNPRARCSAVELSWLWLRHQPGSELSQWFRQRTLNAGKRTRRIAIVALARKLVVALWRYLTTGLVPAGAVLKSAKA